MTSLRAAVIGLGVGERHIAGYRAAPDCEVAWICDTSAERLDEVGDRYPDPRRTTDPEEVLAADDVDVVSVASYDDAHFAQAKAALLAGKHAFVEKPLCQREEELDELHALLRDRPDLELSSNLVLRLSPRFQELRRMVADGELGILYYVEGDYDYGRVTKLTEGWRGDLERYSVVLGGAVHLIDLLLWITGDRPAQVVGAAGNRIATAGTKFRFDDLVVATVEFESGLVAKIGANFGCVHPHFHGVKVFGTEGTFVNALGPAAVYRRGPDGVVGEAVESPYPAIDEAGLVPGFVASIRGESPPAVTAEEVFRAMSVCFAIERSHATGQAVEVHDFD